MIARHCGEWLGKEEKPLPEVMKEGSLKNLFTVAMRYVKRTCNM